MIQKTPTLFGTYRLSNATFVCSLGIFLSFVALSGCKKDVEVELDSVKRRTLLAQVSESGVIQPDVQVPIAPDVSGEVTAIYIKEGQFVKKGDLLFEIRPDNYQAALEQSTASLNTARADHANAQSSLKQAETNLAQDSINFYRNKKLYEEKVIAQTDFENFRLKYQLTKTAIETARQSINAAYFRIQSATASVKQASDQLGRTRVYASMDGVVTVLNVQLGQRVVGTGMMTGTEIMKIADLTHMEVEVMINENDIVNLQIGDTATVEVDAYKDKKFKGLVTEVAYSANVTATGSTDQITNYPVKVAILPESYAGFIPGLAVYQSPFRPGMSAVVSVYTERADNVLSIPIQSVTLDPAAKAGANAEIVYLYTPEGIVKAQPVKTGISDDTYIEIKSGLAENARVVSGPYTTISKLLKDEMKVIVIDPEKKKKENKPPAPEKS